MASRKTGLEFKLTHYRCLILHSPTSISRAPTSNGNSRLARISHTSVMGRSVPVLEWGKAAGWAREAVPGTATARLWKISLDHAQHRKRAARNGA